MGCDSLRYFAAGSEASFGFHMVSVHSFKAHTHACRQPTDVLCAFHGGIQIQKPEGGVVHFVYQLISLLLDRDSATDETSQGRVLGRAGREGHCLLHIAAWETFLWMQ